MVATTFFALSRLQNPPHIECDRCNVILMTVEVVRTDHLGINGYARNTSPNINNFFNDGYVFKNAFVSAPNTLPSHMSIFTGLYPSHHKVINPSPNLNILSDDIITLPEILKLYGYKTAAFVSNKPQLNPVFGFGRGFDEYTKSDFVANITNLYNFINSSKNEKFFLFINNDYAHDPYVLPPPYDTVFDKDYKGKIIGNEIKFDNLVRQSGVDYHNSTAVRDFWWSFVNESDPKDVNHVIALYDGEIYEVDSFFGDFIHYLKSLNILNKTIIIFSSGSGEEFYEHGGWSHGLMYDEQIHVPLLIYVPNSAHATVNDQVGNFDIFPTILSILGIPHAQNIDARDLQFLMENPGTNDPYQVLYLEYQFQNGVRTPQWKLIKTINGTTTYEFFNLKNDPNEKNNLDGKYPVDENYLKDILNTFETSLNSSFIDVKYINTKYIGYP